MVNILILGATGFIGFPVATALRRAGHIVYALVRDSSSSKAQDLERQEVITFKGDAKEDSTWSQKLAGVDIIIDSTSSMLGADVFRTVVEAAKSRPKGAPKLTYIYTSGVWVHGDTRKQVTDRSILPGPIAPQLVTTWRPALEQQIISNTTRDIIDVIIIRPGDVFGGSSTNYSHWFKPLLEAKKSGTVAQVPGRKDTLVATVHKDDLAKAYCLIVEKSSILASISHPVFDITNPVESLYQIIVAAGIAIGLDDSKIQFVEPTNSFLAALSASVVTSSERVRDLAGWQPRHPSLTAGMEIYMRAFLAHQQV